MLKHNFLVALGVTAIAFSAQALAVVIPIGNVTLTTGTNVDGASTHLVWQSNGAGLLTSIGAQSGPYESFLAGNAAAPGSNIELQVLDTPAEYTAWVAGMPPTTLSGDFGGANSIMLSSPTYTDWMAGSNALAKAYISDALASVGYTISSGDLATAAAAFVLSPMGAFRVSDPNIAYVNNVDGGVQIGLQGLLDATAILQPLAPPGITLPAQPQASEVVKYTYGKYSGFAYSFSATATNQYAPTQTGDCAAPPIGGVINPACSYTGNYEVTIPEPASIALLALGLAGLGFGRRVAAH